MKAAKSLLSRAAALAATTSTILPLAVVTTADASALQMDFFGSGLYDNSGWFASDLTPLATGGGITQGNGFKLYGTDSMSDSAFYRTDSEGMTQARYDGDGLGLIWGGAINGALSAGDVIAAPFEFTYDYTWTAAYEGDSYTYNWWQLTVGVFEWTGESTFNWETDYGYSQIYPFASNYTNGYGDGPGHYDKSGELSLEIEDHQLEYNTATHWFVELVVFVEHENDYGNYDGPFNKLNGDTLSVIVPQNSIDIEYTAVPEPSCFLIPVVAGLFLLSRRRKS